MAKAKTIDVICSRMFSFNVKMRNANYSLRWIWTTSSKSLIKFTSALNLFMCLNICVNAYTYSDVRQSWADPALRWKEDCGRTWVLMASAVQAPYAAEYWFLIISMSNIKPYSTLYLSFYCRWWTYSQLSNIKFSVMPFTRYMYSADMTST